LNKLGELCRVEGRPGEAEKLWKRAIRNWETTFGPEHPISASALNNLGMLYSDQGRVDEAEALFRRALAIQQKAFGAEHPDVARMMNNLAGVYQRRRQYPEAEDIYHQVLAIQEKKLGPEHSEVARTKFWQSYFAEGRSRRRNRSMSVRWLSKRKLWGANIRMWQRPCSTIQTCSARFTGKPKLESSRVAPGKLLRKTTEKDPCNTRSTIKTSASEGAGSITNR
jgi:Tfp pilus assembly protein PilF